jgi:hypothetical protein
MINNNVTLLASCRQKLENLKRRKYVCVLQKTGVLGENHRLAASHGQILSHNVVMSTHRHGRESNKRKIVFTWGW